MLILEQGKGDNDTQLEKQMSSRENKSRCKITYQKISQRPAQEYLAFIICYDVVLEMRVGPLKETNSTVTWDSQFHSLGFNRDLSGAFGGDSFIPTAL